MPKRIKLPVQVRRFEWLMLLYLCIGLVSSILWQQESKGIYGEKAGLSLLVFGQFFAISLNVFITYSITRKRSSMAKWIYVWLAMLGMLSSGMSLIGFGTSRAHQSAFLLMVPLQIYMTCLLFSSEFEKWLKKPGSKKTKNWMPVIAGVFGFLFLSIIGIVIYFQSVLKTIPASIYEDIAQKNLKQSIEAIEYYKQVNGSYPVKLEDLDEPQFQRHSFLYDSHQGVGDLMSLKMHQYGVEADGQHYFLFDAGADQVSGTADDLYPVISEKEASHIGYVKK